MNSLTQRTPWYREPWPWILITGPLLVVVAGIATAWIAYTRGDTVISEDYYRQGLAVQQTLTSSEHAKAHGLTAGIKMTAEGNVSVALAAVSFARGRAADRPSIALVQRRFSLRRSWFIIDTGDRVSS